MFDVLIRAGQLVDGVTPAFKADLGIVDGKIAAIGNLGDCDAAETIEAEGLTVCPGFIDIHSHSDATILVNRPVESAVRQGVTTIVNGNCGFTLAPVRDKELIASRTLGYSADLGLEIDWRSFGEYLDRLRTPGVSVNVVPLLGHGAIRMAVMGFDTRAATDEELGAMKRLVDESMEQGAAGFSSGLEYSPGKSSNARELTELCQVVGKHGGVYATHIRDRGFSLLEAIAEGLEAVQGTGLHLQVSHLSPRLWTPPGLFDRAIDLIYHARERGISAAFDTLVEEWGTTALAAVFPPWVNEGKPLDVLARLRDPQVRQRIREYTDLPFARLLNLGRFDLLLLQKAPKHKQFEGKSLAEVARLMQMDGYDAVFDVLLSEGAGLFGVMMREPHISEQLNRELIKHPICGVMSDGAYTAPYGPSAGFYANPAAYGMSARIFEKHVRQDKTLTLEEGVRKLTSLPAQEFGLRDRGILRQGAWADIVVFSPQAISNRATWDHPDQYPLGIEYVLVNGQVTVAKGQHTGALNGRVLSCA